jgi:chaperone required for assembly of F1-ATPase
MKRFWEQADIERDSGEDSGGFIIRLDGKPMRLPSGETLVIGERPLAEAIAAEWRGPAMGAEIRPSLLPLTQLAATARFRIGPDPAATAASIAAYARSDLLCYRAEEPPDLVHRQQAAWQPWLDRAAQRYDAVLAVTRGITAIDQSPQALAALARAVAAQDAHGLAGLGVMVPILGSLVLGLAVVERALDAGEAFRLSTLDEVFQEEHWGVDEDAVAQRARAAQEVRMAARYVLLTRSAA